MGEVSFWRYAMDMHWNSLVRDTSIIRELFCCKFGTVLVFRRFTKDLQRRSEVRYLHKIFSFSFNMT